MASKARTVNKAAPYATVEELFEEGEIAAKFLTLHVGLETFGPVKVNKTDGPFAMGNAKMELVKLAKLAGIAIVALPLG